MRVLIFIILLNIGCSDKAFKSCYMGNSVAPHDDTFTHRMTKKQRKQSKKNKKNTKCYKF